MTNPPRPGFASIHLRFIGLLLLVSTVVVFGCGDDSDDGKTHDTETERDNVDAGDSGDTDTDDGDTETETEDDEIPTFDGCTPEAHALSVIDIPNPLISVGASVVASDHVSGAGKLTDGNYAHSGARFGMPAEDDPPWAAIELDAGPTRLLLTWADTGWNAYTNQLGGAPAAYRLEVSGDSTDGVDGTWTEVAVVADNPARTRGHSFDFEGMTWVKLVITAASKKQDPQTGEEVDVEVKIDEIALYDISAAGEDRSQDTWFFMGDSITQAAFHREFGSDNFDGVLNSLLPDFQPAYLNGGIGGELASDGAGHIVEWLAINPDFQHFAVSYGTNDAWGHKKPNASFKTNLTAIVDAILDAGRTPHLSFIPYADPSDSDAPDSHVGVAAFNQVIADVISEKELPCGPDFYQWFMDNPDELDSGGIHPTKTGSRSINRVWAETAKVFYVAP